MPTLPSDNEFIDAATTESTFKSKFTQMLAYFRSLLGSDGTTATAQATLGIPNATSRLANIETVVGTDGLAATARQNLGLASLTLDYVDRGAWATATAYHVDDQVTTGGIAYLCVLAHTSGVFATDEAAGNWVIQQGLNNITGLQTIAGAAALRTITPSAARRIWMSYHTTAGDSGGGIFRGVTGAAAGTYGDNDSTVIIPNGGDGSAAWLRNYGYTLDSMTQPPAVAPYRTPFDDFNAADNSLIQNRVMPSGHAWSTTGTGAATAKIMNKQMYSVANVYAKAVDNINNITEAYGAFSFTETANPTTANRIVLILDKTGNLQDIIHLEIFKSSIFLQKRVAGVWGGGSLGGGVEKTGLNSSIYLGGDLIPDRIYHIGMKLVGTTLSVYMPDGRTLTWVDANFPNLVGSTAHFQITGSGVAADTQFSWDAISAGKRAIMPADSQGGIPDLTSVIASSVLAPNISFFSRGFVSAAIGWYTIATEINATVAHTVMGGSILLYAVDSASGRESLLSLDVGIDGGRAPEIVKNTLLGRGEWNIISNVRASQDVANKRINLDIYINQAATIQLYVGFRGRFTPFPAPVVGAVALADYVVEYPVSKALNLDVGSMLQHTIAANGWYTIATQKWATAALYLAGEITAYIHDAAGRTAVLKFSVTAANGSAPTLIKLYSRGAWGGYPMPTVRCSQDDTNAFCHVDFNFTKLPNYNVELVFDGGFTPVSTPVVGATALASFSTLLTI